MMAPGLGAGLGQGLVCGLSGHGAGGRCEDHPCERTSPPLLIVEVGVRRDSKWLGQFLGKWNGENETAEQFTATYKSSPPCR